MKYRAPRRPLQSWILALAALAALTACGGGDDDGAPVTAPPPAVAPGEPNPGLPQQVVVRDSFGDVVSDAAFNFVVGGGGGDSGGDGTAGDGAGIVNGKVEVTDVNGRMATATTDSQGYYRVKLTGMTAPFVLKVTAPNGKVYHSLNTAAPRTNAFITMNITGLTDKVASDVARAGGRSGAAQLTPQIVQAQSAAVGSSIASLRSAIEPVIVKAGIAVNTFDPLAVAFRPNLLGYDYVLENTDVTVAADGSTQVAISRDFVPTLAGTWRLELKEDVDNTFVTTGNFPAAAVPTPDSLRTADELSAVVQTIFTADAQAIGGTITRNGNTLRLVGTNTDYTIIINSVNYAGYQSCTSNCGVGATIVFSVNVTLTEEGTYQGQFHPRSTITETYELRYTRLN